MSTTSDAPALRASTRYPRVRRHRHAPRRCRRPRCRRDRGPAGGARPGLRLLARPRGASSSASLTSSRPTGSSDVAPGAATLVGYLAIDRHRRRGLRPAADPHRHRPVRGHQPLPSDRAWAEGVGLLVWMIGVWLVAARYALKGVPPVAGGRGVTAPTSRPRAPPPPDRYPRSAMPTETRTLYDRAGGTPFFEALVDRFYAGVADRSDPSSHLSGSRPRRRDAPASAVPDPVLGRADDLRRGARPPPAPDAPRAVRDRSGRARPLAGPHAGGGRGRWRQPDDVAAELERYFAMAAEAMRNR